MVIGIIGENCSGKSTLAKDISKVMDAEIITGRDYLRMARSETEAASVFREKLKSAVAGSNIIYVISEPDQLAFLPEDAVRVLVYADLDVIKARFRSRMPNGLPPQVEHMLERKHGMFDDGIYDYRFDGSSGDTATLCEQLMERKSGRVKQVG